MMYEYALTEESGLINDVISEYGSWTRFRASNPARSYK
jgi:hypothetical protein